MEEVQRQPEEKAKRCRFPYLLDLVQDHIVSRTLTVLVAFLLFAFSAKLIVGTAQEIESNPSTVTFEKRPAVSMALGIEARQKITPLIRVLKDDGYPAVNITAEVRVSNLETIISKLHPVCDRATRLAIAGSLEYMRLSAVCGIELKYSAARTNTLGQATFPNFHVSRGPQGIYEFKIHTDNDVKSDGLDVNIASPVYTIYVLNSEQEMRERNTVEVGKPFPVTPVVKVLDSDGAAVPGKRVVAFSWPEPLFNPVESFNALFDAYKYAMFANQISTETDSEGVANFSGITVLGYTYQVGTFLHFAVDGSANGEYQPDLGFIINSLKSYPYFYMPTMIYSSVSQVVIVKAPPSVVVEGESFPEQPIIRVLDTDGQPLRGKLVWALKAGHMNSTFRGYYEYKDKRYQAKEIIYPIPGTYDDNFMDPVYSDKFEPAFTNEKGEVQFTKLGFSYSGHAGASIEGLYTVNFVCDGVKSDPVDIRVKSSVGRLSFVEQPPSSVQINPLADSHISPVLEIVATNGKKILGKMPLNVTLVPTDGSANGSINGYMHKYHDAFKASGVDGLFVIHYRFSEMAKESIKVKMRVFVDDTQIESDEFTVSYNPEEADNSVCTHVSIINPAQSEFKVNLDQPLPDIVVMAANLMGQPAYIHPDCFAKIIVFLESEKNSVTELPPALLSPDITAPSLSFAIDSTTGRATVKSLTYSTIPKGTYKMQFLSQAYCSGSGEFNQDFCFSHDAIKLTVETDISDIGIKEIQSINSSDLMFNNRVLKAGEELFLTLQLYKSNEELAKNYKTVVKLMPLQIPPSLYGKYKDALEEKADYEAMKEFFDVTQIGESTNSEGEIGARLRLKGNYYGRWAVIINVGAGISIPIIFKTDFPVAKVEIRRQPAFAAKADVKEMRVGDIFTTSPEVRVLSENGASIAGVTVTTLIAPGCACDNGNTGAMLDLYTFSCSTLDSMTAYVTGTASNSFKSKVTDSSGVAKFTKLGFIDVKERACLKLVFAVGEPGMYVASEVTNETCVVNDYIYEVDSKLSLTISDSHQFGSPPIVRIKRKVAGEYDKSGTIIIAGLARYIDGERQENKWAATKQYMTNQLCVFQSGSNKEGICSDLKIIKSDNPFIAQTTFTALTWLKPSIQSSIQLEFASILKTKNAAVTSPIKIASVPAQLAYIKQPPETVNVGQLFIVQMKAMIADGTALGKALVTCNVTRNVKVGKISSIASMAKLSYSSLVTDSIAHPSALGSYSEVYYKALAINQSQTNPRDPIVLFDLYKERVQNTTLPANLQDLLKKDYLNVFLFSIDKQNLVSLYGSGDITINSLAAANERTNVKLEPDRGSGRTNTKGLVYLTMKIMSGVPDNYSVVCSSGQMVSPKSSQFTLTNSISRISFAASEQTVEVDFKKGAKKKLLPTYGTLPHNPIVSLWNEDGTPYTGDVYEVKLRVIRKEVVDYVDDKIGLEGVNFTVPEMQLIYTYAMQKSKVSQKMQKVWGVVTSAGKSLGISTGAAVDLKSKNLTLYAVPGMSGKYEIRQLRLKFVKPEKYYLVVTVNGVESERSGEIKVIKEEDPNAFVRACPLLVIILIYVLCAVLIVANIVWSNSVFHVIGILLAAFAIVCVSLNPVYEDYFTILLIVIFSLMIINLLEILFLRARGSETFQTHENIKRSIYREYTFQKIFGRPSEEWRKRVAPLGKQREPQMSPYSEVLDKLDAQRQAREADFPEEKVSSDERDQMRSERTLRVRPSQPKPLPPSMLKSAYITAKKIFTPFWYEYYRLKIQGCFYYPQRFLAAFAMGIMTLVLVAATMYAKFDDMIDSLESLKISVHKATYGFVNQAASTSMTFSEAFSDPDLEPLEDLISDLNESFDDIIRAFTVGFLIAFFLTLAIYLVSTINSFVSFRSTILNLRQGKWHMTVPRTTFPVPKAMPFTGGVLSCYLVGFAIVFGTMFLVFFILSLHLFWELVYEYLWVILGIFIPMVVKYWIVYVIKKTAATPAGVYYRIPFSILDFVVFYLALAAGLVISLLRYIYGFFLLSLGQALMDRPAMANWVVEWWWIDETSEVWFGSVMMHYWHNNPMFVTLGKCCTDVVDKYREERGDKEGVETEMQPMSNGKLVKARNKFQLALLLMANPHLQSLRRRPKPELSPF